MRTLTNDTSVLASIGLDEDGVALARAVDPHPRRQAEGLGVLLQECLTGAGVVGGAPNAGLDRIVVGVGPGPFTALRAGLAFASALGRGLGLPVLGVPSLAALGKRAEGEGVTLVLTDAKRKEVYSAAYRKRRAPSSK